MDEVDSAIIRELHSDARLSNRELAARIGIAASSCHVRTRALRDRGVLAGFHAEVNLAMVGLPVQALIAFQVRPLSRQVIQNFQAFALSLPQVRAVYVLAGNDDFLIHVAVPDLPALHGMLVDHFSKRREVIGFRTSVIYTYASQPQLTLPATE
ncbi:MAG TPA: Lrp/AsnC family transcriptional regulator [Streptosporangiaceae bacterium]|nr:Lrp/AsnC family transcriptional regulator [Streptosporangiaceae bacterium]